MAAIAFEHGGLLGLATLVLYAWIAPHHVVDGDNAEFATLGAIGGIAHPSGYPAYLLWLHAFAWLPGESPAHTAALATAILAAASAVALHAACRAWGARPAAAALTVALFAGGPFALRIQSEAEVFAMNGLVVALVLWLSAREAPLRGYLRAGALGLVAGLGLANHLTCALVAPVGLYGVVRGVREARNRPAAIAIAIVALVVGLAPYAYALLAPDTPLSWGTVRSADDLLGLVTRRDYGGAGAFASHGAQVSAWASLAALATTIGRAWLWAPAVLGLVTLVRRIARPDARETRAAWAMLAVAWLVAGPVLAARFDVAPEGVGLYVCRRFHMLPALLLAIPVAIGLTELASRLPERLGQLAPAAAPLALVAFAGLSLPYVQAVHTPAVERYAQNVLRSLPKDAVLIEASDELNAGGGYVQWALGERQDVVLVTWGLMTLDWYRARVERRGIIAAPGTRPLSVRIAEAVLRAGRPLFVDTSQANILAAFPSYPHGAVIRVLPHGVPPPPIDDVLALNKTIFAAYQLDDPRPGPHDEYPTEIHRRYAGVWQTLGHALDASGKREDAAWAFEAAREIGPQP